MSDEQRPERVALNYPRQYGRSPRLSDWFGEHPEPPRCEVRGVTVTGNRCPEQATWVLQHDDYEPVRACDRCLLEAVRRSTSRSPVVVDRLR